MTFTATTLRELRALGLDPDMVDKIVEIFERANIKKPKKGDAADRATRATRLSEDWVLPADWREMAIAMGLRPHEVDREALKMKNWSLSSKNGAKVKWKQTWQNWCVSVLERAGRPINQPGVTDGKAGEITPDKFDEKTWRAIAQRFKQTEIWDSKAWGPPPTQMDCLMPAGLL